MGLLLEYKKICEDEEAFEQYSQTGKGKYGRIFEFLNTNYRYLKTFVSDYDIFKEIDGKDRIEWEKYEKNGQDKYKHYVVNMINTKFFYKDARAYYKTEKGKVVEKLSSMSKEDFNDAEKWLIIFLLIGNSTFENTSSYPFEKAKWIFEKFLAVGLSEEEILESTKKFILGTRESRSVNNIFNYDYTYLDSFYQIYKNYDFLNIYFSSTKEEKEELHEYIKKNRIEKHNKCILAKKYESGGVYDREMIRTNAKIIYIANKIVNLGINDFNNFIDSIVNTYSEIEIINKGKIKQFIYTNKEVFEIIYYEIFNIDYLEFDSNKEDLLAEDSESEIEEKLDETSINNLEKIRRISTVLKRQAKERSKYKCELEDLNMCKYFTSKDTNKNYLEVHHFIPREFSNNYERTIEIIENYICLCPSCHRLIHNATDRERLLVINYLFNKRKDSLLRKGLDIDIKIIEQYYKIEE